MSHKAGNDPTITAVEQSEISFAERAARQSLHRTERRIVTQLLEIEPFELGTMTSSDLSERSGASRSSIDRLSRKLGYAGLKEMRKALLKEAQAAATAPRSSLLEQSQSIEIAQQVMDNLSVRIAPFLRALSHPGLLDQFLEWLLDARNIVLFGAGESAAVCSTIHMRLLRLGLPIRFSQDQHTQVTNAALMRSGDLAIAISFSGRSRHTVWAAKTAKDNGAMLVAIASTNPSPLSRMADLHLPLPHGGNLPGSSEVFDRILSVAIGQVLFECATNKRPELLERSLQVDDLFGQERL